MKNNTITNLVNKIIEYGQESCLCDRDIIEELIECGLTQNDFIELGFWNFVKDYFLDSYDNIALLYAEKHGIIEYYIKSNMMIYYSSFPMEHKTVKATVNLDTLKEKRKYLSRYYPAYDKKIGGKIQANYCI